MPTHIVSPRPADLSRRRSVQGAAVVLAVSALLLPAVLLAPAEAESARLGTVTQPFAPEMSARPGGFKLNAPSVVDTGQRFALRGRVQAGSGKRAVTISTKRGGGWKKLAKVNTNRKGVFRARITAGSTVGRLTLKVRVSSRGRVVAKKTLRITVVAPASPTAVTATWASTGTSLGGPISVSGTVSAPDAAGRTAVLQQQLPSGWRAVGSALVGADGSYAIAAPNDWLYNTAMRVVVAASAASNEGSSEAVAVSVSPSWTPPGAATDWTELSQDLPLRYDPCRVITYRTNLALGAPAGAAAAITEALRQITLSTGLRFQHLGSTTAVFAGEGAHAAYPSDATLIVGFATAAHTTAPFDNGGTIGWGGSSDSIWARSPAIGEVWKVVEGGAVLKADASWTQPSMLEALTHEIGHAVGLGHAAVTDQVMFPVSEGANLVWGAGDLAGLRSAGLQSGCLEVLKRSPAGPSADQSPGLIALP